MSVVLALFVVASTLSNHEAQIQWALTCLAATPLMFYLISLGQTSAWIMAAAAVTLVDRNRWLDAIGGVLLGLTVLTKLTPLAIAVAFWLIGRRPFAAWAMIGAGLLGCASVSRDISGWHEFGVSFSRLAREIISGWNNASLDAEAMRLTSGIADALFRTPTSSIWLGLLLVRVAGLLFLARMALDQRRTDMDRAAAIWLGWLVATPLLWLHYLVVLLPILGMMTRRGFAWAPIVAFLLSMPVLLFLSGVNLVVVGHAATAAWVAAALWISAIIHSPARGGCVSSGGVNSLDIQNRRMMPKQ